MSKETVSEALRAVPPVGVGGLTFCGIYLNEWVMLGTMLWTLFLIIDKLPVVITRIGELVKLIKKWRGNE